ncbi:Replication factor C (RF-C) subunit [Nowakowskiella sp. JEL0407]|nr:Replication factor C (RF-C) subunit [Nowakowskiella sp. JEL0407]
MDLDNDINDVVKPFVSIAKANTKAKKMKGKGKQTLVDPSDNLPWVEKYRPSALDELISHADIISTITRFIDENKLPHLLFYGPPGTGKTSTILACARRLYGAKFRSMILEMNASDDRGIDAVRDQIKNFASTKTVFNSGFKLIILDEADAMTQTAQAALRRSKSSFGDIVFSVITWFLMENSRGKVYTKRAILYYLQLRDPLKEEQILPRLEYVIESENVEITKDGVEALLKLSQGDMRKTLNILQSAHAAYDKITKENIYMCTGAPVPSDIERICEWFMNTDFQTAYQNDVLLTDTMELKLNKGLALTDIISSLFEVVRGIEIPREARSYLLDKFADIEYKLSMGSSEKIQLGALLGAFKIAVDMIEKVNLTGK